MKYCTFAQSMQGGIRKFRILHHRVGWEVELFEINSFWELINLFLLMDLMKYFPTYCIDKLKQNSINFLSIFFWRNKKTRSFCSHFSSILSLAGTWLQTLVQIVQYCSSSLFNVSLIVSQMWLWANSSHIHFGLVQ